ncbi:hypothetical protein CRE_16641 [Caenorhabditis remanei]|uniref:Secreted protein n=1 Tax=Caenorhabditis remanei TaxID=31234 RepID=E3MAW1_CAERE|nr:hypothetical protein CRE_16641 [Caenorhabditis remanei]
MLSLSIFPFFYLLSSSSLVEKKRGEKRTKRAIRWCGCDSLSRFRRRMCPRRKGTEEALHEKKECCTIGDASEKVRCHGTAPCYSGGERGVVGSVECRNHAKKMAKSRIFERRSHLE